MKSLSNLEKISQQKFTYFENDCSGFVKSVAEDYGYPLPKLHDDEATNANVLVEYLKSDPEWKSLGSGSVGLNKALELVDTHFIIIGATNKELGTNIHGHVTILLPESKILKRPIVYNAAKDAPESIKGKRKLSEVFRRKVLEKVNYFGRERYLPQLP